MAVLIPVQSRVQVLQLSLMVQWDRWWECYRRAVYHGCHFIIHVLSSTRVLCLMSRTECTKYEEHLLFPWSTVKLVTCCWHHLLQLSSVEFDEDEKVKKKKNEWMMERVWSSGLGKHIQGLRLTVSCRRGHNRKYVWDELRSSSRHFL